MATDLGNETKMNANKEREKIYAMDNAAV